MIQKLQEPCHRSGQSWSGCRPKFIWRMRRRFRGGQVSQAAAIGPVRSYRRRAACCTGPIEARLRILVAAGIKD